MTIKIYNTLSGKKETLRKVSKRPLHMFVCGPTVYDEPHLGNVRTFISFDMFVRYLRHQGREVFYLQNITDIDDKIIARAKEQSSTAERVARHFEDVFLQLMKEVRVTSVNRYARATDHISQIVSQVKTLIKKGFAYKIDGDGYYFSLVAFPEYGKLARRTVEQAEDGVTRIDESDKKRNRGDFCLWKFSKPGEPSWESDLGRGRPGWHIEDTAITEHFFGPQYDLHGGGLDLKFPHHEAEIAQQEAASGKKPFVKYWMHAGLISVSGQKMSKSLGNFITAKDFLAENSVDVLRMIVFSHHYRSPIDFSDAVASHAQKTLHSFGAIIAKLRSATANGKKTSPIKLDTYKKKFWSALDDDFNSPQALSILFDLQADAYRNLKNLSRAHADAIASFFTETLKIFGIEELLPKIPLDVEKLIQKRELYRRNKQFVESDTLRKEIEQLGYVVEDTDRGPLALPKE